jgi:tRNA 2-thiouridine synthesizing protein A
MYGQARIAGNTERSQAANQTVADQARRARQGGLQVNFDKELDARGLACPLPIVKTNKTISQMTSGQVLRVMATDTGSVADMKAYSEQTGHQLLSSSQENGVYVFYLKRS